jgi:hypothetical protein
MGGSLSVSNLTVERVLSVGTLFDVIAVVLRQLEVLLTIDNSSNDLVDGQGQLGAPDDCELQLRHGSPDTPCHRQRLVC